jgi:hypothetical protein
MHCINILVSNLPILFCVYITLIKNSNKMEPIIAIRTTEHKSETENTWNQILLTEWKEIGFLLRLFTDVVLTTVVI